MYRRTKRSETVRAKVVAMRRGREAARMRQPAPDYPADLPNLRRELVVIDYDFGRVEHRLQFFRTDRVDCYRVEVDGKPWKSRIGWSRALAGLRKSLPRVRGSE